MGANSLAAAGQLSGSFLLARKDHPVFEWVGGMADREKSIPVSATTCFRMARPGKMITAVAILQLTEAGRISLDGRLAQYLPSYPNRAVASAIAIRQLLNHTSGTVDQHIYGPAGMTSTGSVQESELVPGRAYAYTKTDGE